MQRAARILVVDDDPSVRAMLRRDLEAEGFHVTEAGTEASLLQSLDQGTFDLITLDLGLGSSDGLALARRIWEARNIPIVMISGRGSGEERIIGLENGADDYIAKPFLSREVILRIRSVLGRYSVEDGAVAKVAPSTERETYSFGGGTLNMTRRELINPAGHRIELTDAEFSLLAILLQRPNRILSRDELMQLLKGRDWSPLDRTLDKLVARLRKKIEPAGEAPHFIKSVRGIGYVLASEVTHNQH